MTAADAECYHPA